MKIRTQTLSNRRYRKILGVLFALVTQIGVFAPNAEAAVSFTGCSRTQKNLIENAMSRLRSRLPALKRHIESQTGHSMGDTWTSQWSNADIKCDSRSLVCRGNIAAFAVPGTNNVTICNENSEDYINLLLNFYPDADDQQTCMGALIAHEFVHNGFGFEGKADEVGAATADFWIENIGGNRHVTTSAACGFED